MNNKVIGLIFRAFSQILHNQEKIMRHYGEENFFLLEDTNELSIKYGELAQEYFKKEMIKIRDPEKLDSFTHSYVRYIRSHSQICDQGNSC